MQMKGHCHFFTGSLLGGGGHGGGGFSLSVGLTLQCCQKLYTKVCIDYVMLLGFKSHCLCSPSGDVRNGHLTLPADDHPTNQRRHPSWRRPGRQVLPHT